MEAPEKRDEVSTIGGLHCIFRPPPASAPQPWPLLLFLHGAGERGGENGDLSAVGRVLKHGPWRAAAKAGCAILAPQCPKDRTWPALAKEIVQAVEGVFVKHPLDRARCYATGLSMGAFGIWAVAIIEPHLFAAVVPVCGGFSVPLPRGTVLSAVLQLAREAPQPEVEALRHLPVWLFHGSKDKVVDPRGSKDVFAALGGRQRGKQQLRMKLYEDSGHQIWELAYAEGQLFPWLLTHRCGPRAGKLQVPKQSAQPVPMVVRVALGALVDDPADDPRLQLAGAPHDSGVLDATAYTDLREHFASEAPKERHPDPNNPGVRTAELGDLIDLRKWEDDRGAGWKTSFGSGFKWFSFKKWKSWRLAFLLARLQRDIFRDQSAGQGETAVARAAPRSPRGRGRGRGTHGGTATSQAASSARPDTDDSSHSRGRGRRPGGGRSGAATSQVARPETAEKSRAQGRPPGSGRDLGGPDLKSNASGDGRDAGSAKRTRSERVQIDGAPRALTSAASTLQLFSRLRVHSKSPASSSTRSLAESGGDADIVEATPDAVAPPLDQHLEAYDAQRCLARSSHDGHFGQCKRGRVSGADLCEEHQEELLICDGLQYGFMDGPDPSAHCQERLLATGDASTQEPKRPRGSQRSLDLGDAIDAARQDACLAGIDSLMTTSGTIKLGRMASVVAFLTDIGPNPALKYDLLGALRRSVEQSREEASAFAAAGGVAALKPWIDAALPPVGASSSRAHHISEAIMLDVLVVLGQLPVTEADLRTTGIGRSVMALRMVEDDGTSARLAAAQGFAGGLVTTWRRQLQAQRGAAFPKGAPAKNGANGRTKRRVEALESTTSSSSSSEEEDAPLGKADASALHLALVVARRPAISPKRIKVRALPQLADPVEAQGAGAHQITLFLGANDALGHQVAASSAMAAELGEQSEQSERSEHCEQSRDLEGLVCQEEDLPLQEAALDHVRLPAFASSFGQPRAALASDQKHNREVEATLKELLQLGEVLGRGREQPSAPEHAPPFAGLPEPLEGASLSDEEAVDID